MIVADANLIADFVWRGSPDADGVWERDPVWVAPPLWSPELRSALGGAVRRSLITVDQAAATMDRAGSIVHASEGTIESRSVFDLSKQSGCSTYDCEYVALAAALRVPLVTSDRQVLRAFPKVAVAPKDFVG